MGFSGGVLLLHKYGAGQSAAINIVKVRVFENILGNDSTGRIIDQCFLCAVGGQGSEGPCC